MERRDSLLEMRGLCIDAPRGKQTVRLADHIDLTVQKRQTFGVVGESGCGKSITTSAILGLLPYPLAVTAGSVRFQSDAGERDLLALPPRELRSVRGREIAMIFQEPMTALDPIFTIEQQMAEALLFHKPHMPASDVRARSLEMLNRVRIPRAEQTLKSYPHQLSGGQLQRVMIAIALINDPRLVIADEPTTALDVTIQAQILSLLNDLKETESASVIMITHDLGVIAETCEQVAVLYAGQVVEEAPVAELFHHPLHPYTSGLLRAVTSISGAARKLYTIPGTVPAAGMAGEGCRFAARCERHCADCDRGAPPLAEVAAGHTCRCWGVAGSSAAEQVMAEGGGDA